MKQTEKQTEKAKLLALFEERRAAGLQDMKFLLANTSEASVEEVCADVNRFYDEIKKENLKTVEHWGDSNRETPAAA